MARTLRVQYPGTIYHVMSRGDHLEIIFRDDQDRELFLATLGEASSRTDWQVHAHSPGGAEPARLGAPTLRLEQLAKADRESSKLRSDCEPKPV